MHYVIGDIHGHLPRLASILKQIKPSETDTIYFLGDVIDRNPDGLNILSCIMEMPNAKMILGNHEYMMLQALTTDNPILYDANLDLWYSNGGDVTHKAWELWTDDQQEEMLKYLKALPLNLEISVNGYDYLLVHGAPALWYNPVTSRYKSQAEFAVRQRISLQDTAPNGKIVIFGHTPTQMYQYEDPPKIWTHEDFIGIDCGCAYEEGRLACVRLEDMQVYYSQSD